MAKNPSKSPKSTAVQKPAKISSTAKTPAESPRHPDSEKTQKTFKSEFRRKKSEIHAAKSADIRLHRSFRRSYREDYERELKAPGLVSHALTTLKVLFAHWKLFGGLLIVAMLLCVLLVGVMNEDTYVKFQQILESTHQGELGQFATSGLLLFSAITTGGFAGQFNETSTIFLIVIFLIVWLVTIYLLRQLASGGEEPRLRDGLFNALGPLLSTLAVAIVIIFDLLPIGLFIVVLSAAVKTAFLATPFYALLFFVFAALMMILSLYLLSGSLLALVATSAPGIYPLVALHEARNLIAGRRIRFIIRLLFGVFIIGLAVCVIMIPLILLDLWLKSSFPGLAGLPFIPACLLMLTCTVFIYFTAYIYLYYRRLLEND